MIAGSAAKMMLIVAIRQRPANWERMSRSIRVAETAENDSVRRSAIPRVFDNSAPLTLSDSSTSLCSRDMACCRARVRSRRTRATLRVPQIAGGRMIKEINESRQSRATIAMAVATAVVRLDATEVAVVVSTDCKPATSLTSRD